MYIGISWIFYGIRCKNGVYLFNNFLRLNNLGVPNKILQNYNWQNDFRQNFVVS